MTELSRARRLAIAKKRVSNNENTYAKIARQVTMFGLTKEREARLKKAGESLKRAYDSYYEIREEEIGE